MGASFSPATLGWSTALPAFSLVTGLCKTVMGPSEVQRGAERGSRVVEREGERRRERKEGEGKEGNREGEGIEKGKGEREEGEKERGTGKRRGGEGRRKQGGKADIKLTSTSFSLAEVLQRRQRTYICMTQEKD